MQLNYIDLIRFSFSFLNTRNPCPFFGVVPSYWYVWLDFAFQVLKVLVMDPFNKSIEIWWPTLEEMHASVILLEQNRHSGSCLRRGVFAMPVATHGDKFR